MSGPPQPSRDDRRYQPLASGPTSSRSRHPSPAIDKRRAAARPAPVLQSQDKATARQKDKFVSLGVPGDDGEGDGAAAGPSTAAPPPEGSSSTGGGGGGVAQTGAEPPTPLQPNLLEQLEQQQQQQQQQAPKRPAFAVPPPRPLPRLPQQQLLPQQPAAARFQPPPPPPHLQVSPQPQPQALPLPYYAPLPPAPAPVAGAVTISGRISVVTVAESLDRPALEALLKAKFPRLHVTGYQEVLHATPSLGEASGDLFVFDYGVACFWGIPTAEEQQLMHAVVRPCAVGALDVREVEVDAFSYHYSATEPPHVQNDVITLNKRFAADHQVKMAISHALAQSTKLAVYEERLQGIVQRTAHLPEMLATTGKVGIERKEIARLIGQVFLQRSAVNLLSTVMSTPEYFWSAPDHLQVLYKRVCEYLELDSRVEVLNTRFLVLQEFLDLLREHQANKHMVRLEWIVIWLIVVEVLVGFFEVAGLVGLFPEGGKSGK